MSTYAVSGEWNGLDVEGEYEDYIPATWLEPPEGGGVCDVRVEAIVDVDEFDSWIAALACEYADAQKAYREFLEANGIAVGDLDDPDFYSDVMGSVRALEKPVLPVSVCAWIERENRDEIADELAREVD